MTRKYLAGLGALVLSAGLGFGLASTASAAVNVSGVTWLPDTGDRGNGTGNAGHGVGVWAEKAFHRTLSVTDGSGCAGPDADGTCYEATVTDNGSLKTLPGNGLAPNRHSAADPGLNIAWPPAAGTVTGTVHYKFRALGGLPAEANIPNTHDDSGARPTGGSFDPANWYENAFATTGVTFADRQVLDYSWTYTTMTGKDATHTAVACETWTDSSTNGDGNDATDGNVTGKQCPGQLIPPPPAVQGDLGDYVNAYGNGLDVFRQHYAAGNIVAGWTATQHDPATLWVRHDTGLKAGGNAIYSIEATRSGGHATGLCLSNPMGGWPDPAGPAGLLIVHCAANPQANRFQQFYTDGSHLVSVINGQAVSPHGTGAQLTASGPASWPGGSDYSWKDYAHLPG